MIKFVGYVSGEPMASYLWAEIGRSGSYADQLEHG